MIAIVEHNHRTVWGVGQTAAEAHQDAAHWIGQKPQFRVGTLDVCELAPGADPRSDGSALYQFVQAHKPVQGALL